MKRKILIGIGVLILTLVAVMFFSYQTNQNLPPPQITANFVDLSKIDKITKFRSCTGHVTVPQDGREMRRNMKHYFWVKKEFNKPQTVEIYAPYDGYVSIVRDEPGLNLEGEIWIRPEGGLVFAPPFGIWQFSVQHIDVKDGLKVGERVKAGELIGYAALSDKRGDSFDVIYGKMSMTTKKIDNWTAPFTDLDTVFNHMSGKVFGEYKQKGVNSKEDLIISKEERDQNLCQYHGLGPEFANQEDKNNWVVLK